MKTVLPTWDVCSLWLEWQYHYARNRTNTVYFTDETIYSYGTHYPMARLFMVSGTKFALVNHDGYSMTTKKHRQYVVRNLTRGLIPYIYVPHLFPERDNHQSNMDWFHERLMRAAGYTYHNYRIYYGVKGILEDVNKYAQCFGLSGTFELRFDYSLPVPTPVPEPVRTKTFYAKRRTIRMIGGD